MVLRLMALSIIAAFFLGVLPYLISIDKFLTNLFKGEV